MLKVIHIRESHLLNIIKEQKICLPSAKKFEVGEKIILDTEGDTALAEIIGIMNFNAIIAIREIQSKLFPPF